MIISFNMFAWIINPISGFDTPSTLTIVHCSCIPLLHSQVFITYFSAGIAGWLYIIVLSFVMRSYVPFLELGL